jgi:glycogen phosphorylase
MMKTKATTTPVKQTDDRAARLVKQYGCGPIEFSGTDNGLYERHLLFDNVVKLTAAGDRERFEAVARSVRYVLAQRWVLTEETYERENAKRVY